MYFAKLYTWHREETHLSLFLFVLVDDVLAVDPTDGEQVRDVVHPVVPATVFLKQDWTINSLEALTGIYIIFLETKKIIINRREGIKNTYKISLFLKKILIQNTKKIVLVIVTVKSSRCLQIDFGLQIIDYIFYFFIFTPPPLLIPVNQSF